MGLSSYVDVAISLETAAISQAGFGTVLVLTTETNAKYTGGDLVREYASMTEVAGDWGSTTDAYKAANAAFAAEPRPTKVKIALATAPVAGVGTLTLSADLVAGNTITATINGTTVSQAFVTDHLTTMNNFAAALAALDDIATAVVSALPYREITLTTEAGYPLVVTLAGVSGGASQAAVTYATTTPAVTIPDSLNALIEEDNDWYGLTLARLKTKHNIINVASWAEGRTKIFGACNSDADVLSNGAGNVLAKLKAKAYNRTFFIYSDTPGDHPESSWAAGQLAEEPGAATWMFKTLPGVTVDLLTSTERTNVLNNNGNVYVPQNGVNMTEQGKMASGQFIDIIHGRDWLEARIAEDIFAQLKKSKKIPYTNKGAGVLEGLVRARLRDAVNKGVLTDDEEFTVTVPKVADQMVNDRAARYFPGIKFDAKLAGAVHKVQVRGTISV